MLLFTSAGLGLGIVSSGLGLGLKNLVLFSSLVVVVVFLQATMMNSGMSVSLTSQLKQTANVKH